MLTRTNRILIVTLAVLLIAAQSFVLADTLSGRVLDPQGNAVPAANIKLFDRGNGGQRNTVSAADGTFSFQGIPAGNYLVEANASDSALIASQQISVSGEQRLDVTLSIAASQTEVVVTASAVPLSITEVAKAVDIVDSVQLNLRNVFQITEAIRALPGVQIQTLEGPGSFTKIRTRGLRMADTAVLIDGMRFRDAGSPQNDAGAFLEDLTTVDTERVEFMRGSGSSLYGSNSMAGVINIVSRPGGGPAHGQFRAEGGGLGMIRSTVSIGGALGTDRLGYSAGMSHVNVTQGVRERSPYRNSSLQGVARYSFTSGLTLSGRFLGNQARLTSTQAPTFTPAILANSPASGFVKAIALPDDQLELFERGQSFSAGNATFIPNQPDPDGRRHSSFYNGSVILQHVVSPSTTYRISYQGVDTHRGYLNGPAGTGFQPASFATSHFNGRTDTGQARIDQRLGRYNFFSGGYEFEREQYLAFDDTPSNSTRTNSIDLQQYSHAIYGQDQIQLFDSRLQLTLSGRAQVFDLRQPVFSLGLDNPYRNFVGRIDTPNVYTGDGAIAYFFRNSQTKLRAHVGNSYRAPSSYERFGGNATGTSFSGDPTLRPERAIAFDSGIDQWLLDSKLELSASYFYTKLQETILSGTLAPGDPFGRMRGYVNGGGGIGRGIELSGGLSPWRSTNLRASYTFVNSDQNTPSVAPDYHKALDLAPHTFTFSLTQWVGRRFHTTFEIFGRSDYENTIFGGGSRLFVFNGATKANAIFGYEIPRGDGKAIEFYGKVENVFNQRAYEDGYIGPQAWAIGGFRIKF
jgi:vitamin B12 transporter